MTYVKINHDLVKFLDQKFYADIFKNDDDAVFVLKTQLLCERFLNVYLEDRLSLEQKTFFVDGKGKQAEILKYFNEKIRVAIALGLPLELARALKHLNGIRNNFAHNFDAKLEGKDVDKYFELVDKFVINTSEPHGLEGPVSQAEATVDGEKIKANENLRNGLVIATFFLMNKSGIWLVNDLNQRGQLKIG